MVTAFAPGRVNLIGEHTDYNDGLALPFAITAGVTVHAEPLSGARVEAEALDLGERDVFPLRSASDVPPGWRAHVRGAVHELRRSGRLLRGTRLSIAGDLPRGAGLSSSAALQGAVCLALLAVAEQTEIDRTELARICARIEHEWVGVESGLLDPLAVLCAQDAQALRIDFQRLRLTPVPLHLGGHQLIALPSGETRALADTGYNERRGECREVSRRLGRLTLRTATREAAALLPERLGRRLRHVISENERVDAAVTALAAGDMPALGALLSASHASLRDDYEVSTDAVEAAVDAVMAAGALGARLVGGGFGGTVIGLMPPQARAPDGAIVLRPGPGARILSAQGRMAP